ncbi:MAG TPA: phosphatase PAP2 family protein [Gemmatimonadaceae bacterium]|nr:phosphatase PAP2 family protein [Gemmatimonadaceae bacterium]
MTLTIALLALAAWPLWLHWRISGDVAPLILDAAVLLVSLATLAPRAAALRPVRDWLPLVAVPILYIELRWIIPAIGAPHRDATVIGWEHLLFPSNPSATLAVRVPSTLLSEALHLAYALYYPLIGIPPMLLFFTGARRQLAATTLALVLVYTLCFLAYPLFPVDGPRFLFGAAHAPAGPVRSYVLALLERGSSRGTAFPSSHVAASVVAALCALQHQRRLGLVAAVVAIGLTIATVYGGFHYAVDALAGLLLGVAVWLLSNAIWRSLDDGETRQRQRL